MNNFQKTLLHKTTFPPRIRARLSYRPIFRREDQFYVSKQAVVLIK
jgi:hypothetical protein